jgi:hypothetical protein
VHGNGDALCALGCAAASIWRGQCDMNGRIEGSCFRELVLGVEGTLAAR